ncbi:MAG: CAP domain-containing protein, partial [Eubacterium sp.]|nr:CAP domain-containing protein [Eubacterium sp.]
MNKKKCFVAWILICSMLVFYIPSMASDGSENSKAADTTVNVEITLEYRQQQARTIFDMVNEFRTGDNAWYWNNDNATKTTYQPNELSALTYDYTLEEVAMQRAAEIALHYSHTRTNGENCFSAFTEAAYPGTARGENIAAGYPTPEAVFIGWREDNDDYAGQGHRRNMLNANMTAIGIGYAYYNGVTYWTMELGNAVTQKTDAVTDGITKVQVTVLNSYIESLSTEEKAYTVACNDVIDVPEVHTQMVTEETWPEGNTVSGTIIEPEWTVSDTAIAEVSNGKIKGKKAGTATLTAKAGTKTTQITLNVTGFTLTDANVVLPEETFVYSGNEITPEPTVTYNGTVLEKGKDYTISYKNNIEAGTEAAVIVTGTGNYSGEVIKNFTISTCAHKWDAGVVTKEASCEEDGIKTITCTICKETKTEVIPATGHKWDAGVVTKEASCEEDGIKTITCTICKETKTE